MNSKVRIAKIGGGLLGGSGVLTLILTLHTNVSSEIAKAETRSKEHVGLKLEPLKIRMKTYESKINNTNKKVNDIYNYIINGKQINN